MSGPVTRSCCESIDNTTHAPGCEIDPQRFRVTFICDCQTDAVFGYGRTRRDAMNTATDFWRKRHARGGAKIADVIVEQVVADSGNGHYEEVTT